MWKNSKISGLKMNFEITSKAKSMKEKSCIGFYQKNFCSMKDSIRVKNFRLGENIGKSHNKKKLYP